MLLGDRSELAFELEPLEPGWPRRSASDRGPWARLSLWIAGKNTCRHVWPSRSSLDDAVAVPLAPIADWLVRNIAYLSFEESARPFSTDVDLHASLQHWKATIPAPSFDEASWIDESYEWSERHFMLAGSDGAWLPDLAFARVDDHLWVSSRPSRFATSGAPEFLCGFETTRVAWDGAFQAIESFVSFIARELVGHDLVEEYPWSVEEEPLSRRLRLNVVDFARMGLGLRPRQLHRLFATADEAELRRLLGLESSRSAEDSVALLSLRDLDAEERSVGEALLRCDREARGGDSAELSSWRSRVGTAGIGVSPEDQGRDAARVLRRELGLDGQPVGDLDSLAATLGIAIHHGVELVSENDHAVAGARRGGTAAVVLLSSPQTRQTWSLRMETARSIGHLLLDAWHGAGSLGAGSSRRATGPRRRRSGSFAAELLLPSAVLAERSGGVLDRLASTPCFEALMSEYGVGAQTAAWQSYNSGLLSSDAVVSELIARHGARES